MQGKRWFPANRLLAVSALAVGETGWSTPRIALRVSRRLDAWKRSNRYLMKEDAYANTR